MRQAALGAIYELARRDPRVLFIGSDIGAGTLEAFKREMPERFFMEGVSEGHLVGMMTGLALTGKIPYLNTIATFLTRRCYEQVLLDAGLHRAKIRLVGSGGGTVYAPLGPTHLALEDFALMRTVPHMAVLAPSDAEEVRRMIPETLDYPRPVYIRLAKGGDPVVSRPDIPFRIGKGALLREGKDAQLGSCGITTKIAQDAALELEGAGISAAVLHLGSIKPFDAETLREWMSRVRAVVSIEEHCIQGGLSSAVAETLAEANFDRPRKFARIGFPDAFLHEYGSQDFLMGKYGISRDNLTAKVKKLLEN